jgi:hypothetical protein
LCCGKCTGKRDFTLQSFLFQQNLCRNLKFLTDYLRKTELFRIGPSAVFAPRTQTYATEQKKWTIVTTITFGHEEIGRDVNIGSKWFACAWFPFIETSWRDMDVLSKKACF